MRSEWLIPAVLVVPFTALSQTMPPESQFVPPAYKVLRFNENYSYLDNPTNRTDWLDQIKYIPLRTNAPDWHLTLGGEVRERFEGNYDPHFGIGGRGANSYWLQRVTLLSDVHLGERVRIFAEGISGLMEGENPPAPDVQDDPLDLQFAFLDVIPYLTDDEKLTVRGGRFGMSFGAGRLVATRAAPNIPSRFDGFEMIYTRPLWEATAFLTRPVEDSGGISGSNPNTTFWGLYVTHWLNTQHQQGFDLYYLGIDNQTATYASVTGHETRHSFGTREFGKWRHWDWDAEQVLQVGSFGDDSILAWTAGQNLGYTWDATWQPRLGLKVGVTSGDHNSGDGQLQTFDALYFKSGYFNDASLIRPQNIIGVHPNLTVNPLRNVTVDGGVNWFWRYSRNDAVYAVPGYIEIPANSNASAYVATAVDLNLQWRIQRHLTFGASYVHFFTGSYVHEAGGKDVNYVSTTLTYIF
ncbi:MAG TPA: alginate export family protein [Verrucomicrobiae bacterium]|nr:alginate export family protein [Verrucomicrobiae bacterium]